MAVMADTQHIEFRHGVSSMFVHQTLAKRNRESSSPSCVAIPSQKRRRRQPLAIVKCSFNLLSQEIFDVILHHLREDDHVSIYSLLCISKSFRSAALPAIYSILEPTQRLITNISTGDADRQLAHIRDHTRHLILPSNLDRDGVKALIQASPHLQYITYRHVNNGRAWLPSDLASFHTPSQVKLHVQDVPLRECPSVSKDLLASIPTDALVSLKLAYPIPPLSSTLDSLRELLTRCTALETFHYHERGQGTFLRLTGNQRLPAFRHLMLESYDWQHSKDAVAKYWTLSSLKSLCLASVPIYRFLKSINMADMAKLTSLQLDDAYARLDSEESEQGTILMHDLILNHIQALEFLEVTCHQRLFGINAILKHAETLTSLRLRDHTGFDNGGICPTLSVADITALGNTMHALRALELDMDCPAQEQAWFLSAVAKLPRLQHLTLHIQTAIEPPGIDEDGNQQPPLVEGDVDLQGAYGLLHALLWAMRCETRIGDVFPLQQLVINVGGWKPTTARRIGSTWRALNELGVFAERRFVFHKSKTLGKSAGRFVLREEACVAPAASCVFSVSQS